MPTILMNRRTLLATWLLLGTLTAGAAPATAADLAEQVPANTVLFFNIPDLKKAYTGYQGTGLGRWIQSSEMKPFRDSLRQTGALSLANVTGILGFDENLLASFPYPACVLAVPAKNGAANIILIQVPQKDPAVATCLAAAEKFHAEFKGVKTPTKLDGAEFATLYVTPRTAPEPAEEHVYFYTHGFFGIGGEVAAVQTLIKNWPAKPADSLAADTSYAGTQKAVARKSDVTWFTRPVAATELFEEPVKPAPKPEPGKPVVKVKKSRPWSLILKQEGFLRIKGISGSVIFNTADADIDYTTYTDAPLPYVEGMRALHWQPGPKLEIPAWVPAGVAELMWMNADPAIQNAARANWFDQIVADGDKGTLDDIMRALRDDPKGPRVDLDKDLWGTFGPQSLQVVDVNGKPNKINPMGRRDLTISLSSDPARVRAALTKNFKGDPKVTRVELPDGEMWFVAPGLALFVDAGSKLPQPNTVAVVGKQVIFANDSEWLKKLLTEKPAVPFAKDAKLPPLIARVATSETNATSVRKVGLMEDTWAASYEEVRAGKPGASESSSVRTIKTLLTGDTSDKYLKQYKLLPAFGSVKPFLSAGGGSFDSFPQGIFSRGFILKPAGASGPMKN